MRFRSVQWVCHAVVAAIAIPLLSPLLQADELPEGKPVRYSDPSDKEDTSEGSSARGQSELLEKLQSGNNNNNRQGSLDGLPAPSVIPSARQVVPDSKSQEALDRRKDWIFSTPEQLILGRDKNPGRDKNSNSGTETENPRGDEAKKQKLTPMEESYLNLFRPASKTGRNEPDRNQKDDARTPAGLRERESQLKQLILSEAPGNVSSLSGVRAGGYDLLGVQNAPITEQNLVQKARAEEYRQLYGLQSPQASMKELFFPSAKTPEAASLGSGLTQLGKGLPGSLKASEPSSIFTPQVQVGMIPSAPQLADVNARALNPAILGAGSMRLDTKPVQPNLAPPTPSFSAPRRTF